MASASYRVSHRVFQPIQDASSFPPPHIGLSQSQNSSRIVLKISVHVGNRVVEQLQKERITQLVKKSSIQHELMNIVNHVLLGAPRESNSLEELKNLLRNEVKNSRYQPTLSPELISLCVVLLAIPELSPLHEDAKKAIEGIYKDEQDLLLCVARGDASCDEQPGARVMAIRSLATRVEEPAVQEVLISLMTTKSKGYYSSLFCREAAKVLIPYHHEQWVHEAVLNGVPVHGLRGLIDLIKVMTLDAAILDAAIAVNTSSLEDLMKNHLENEAVRIHMLEKLLTTDEEQVGTQIAESFRDLSSHKEVQRAFFQFLVNLRKKGEDRNSLALVDIKSVFLDLEMNDEVLEEFRPQLSEVQDVFEVKEIIKQYQNDPQKLRQQLFETISTSKSKYKRQAAVAFIASLVPDDPNELAVFLDKLSGVKPVEQEARLIAALSLYANQKNVRSFLIKRYFVIGAHIEELTLAAIRALRPYINNRDVYSAFYQHLKNNQAFSDERSEIMNCFEPDGEFEEDLKSVFMQIVQENEWQIPSVICDAIARLQRYIDEDVGVVDLLLDGFEKERANDVDGACLRALCSSKIGRPVSADQVVGYLLKRGMYSIDEWVQILAQWAIKDANANSV